MQPSYRTLPSYQRQTKIFIRLFLTDYKNFDIVLRMNFGDFIKKSWDRYVQLTPDASVIHDLLEKKRGEVLINDHLAYRTFNIKGIDRLSLGSIFEQWGYERVKEDLDFPDKKLKASYWLHQNREYPKIFISELMVEQFKPDIQKWVRDLAEEALQRFKKPSTDIFLNATWEPVRFEDYEKYYPTSEYAAWTAAFGIQLNHFTVFINALKSFKSIQELNKYLEANGITLNDQGGKIKGTAEELLEQSSTLAKRIPWKFAGGAQKNVMGCYYEFAKRYPIPGKSELFQGFIPKSADKIFESTYEKK